MLRDAKLVALEELTAKLTLLHVRGKLFSSRRRPMHLVYCSWNSIPRTQIQVNDPESLGKNFTMILPTKVSPWDPMNGLFC